MWYNTAQFVSKNVRFGKGRMQRKKVEHEQIS